MGKYFAKPTVCIHGHKHASKAEAARCVILHDMQKKGEIDDLVVEPTYRLAFGDAPIKMGNGQQARYRPDFQYLEGNRLIVEDVKGFIVRDFPLRAAVFRVCFPDIELRVVK